MMRPRATDKTRMDPIRMFRGSGTRYVGCVAHAQCQLGECPRPNESSYALEKPESLYRKQSGQTQP